MGWEGHGEKITDRSLLSPVVRSVARLKYAVGTRTGEAVPSDVLIDGALLGRGPSTQEDTVTPGGSKPWRHGYPRPV
jgi:hypothetical protein